MPPISLEGDIKLPLPIHMATWLSWAKMLDRLKIYKDGYMMDSQPDDLRLSFERVGTRCQLKVVKIDCVPVYNDRETERDICWQIIDNMREMLGSALPNHMRDMASIHNKPQRLEVLIGILEKGVREAPELSQDEIEKLLGASKRMINKNGDWV